MDETEVFLGEWGGGGGEQKGKFPKQKKKVTE